MGRIGAILVILIDVFAILDVLRSSKQTEKKILWIVVILLLPLVGAVGWYILGRKLIN